jgi:hypothetical protein
MKRAPYPHKTLLEWRDRTVETAAQDLAEASRSHERARDAAARATEERERAEARAASERTATREALEQGRLTARDLAQASAWEHGVSEEMSSLAREEGLAARAAGVANEHETEMRRKLLEAKANHEVIAKDQARHEASARARHLERDEEATEESVQARRQR